MRTLNIDVEAISLHNYLYCFLALFGLVGVQVRNRRVRKKVMRTSDGGEVFNNIFGPHESTQS